VSASPKGAQRGGAERSESASPKGAQRGGAERSDSASPKGAQRGAAERSESASPKGAQRGAAERSSRAGATRAALLLASLLASAAGVRAEREQELEQLRSAIEASRQRVAAYEREGRGLLETLEALDRAAAALEADVRRAARAAEEERRALASLEAERARLEQRLAGTRAAMKSRAVALYKAGEAGSLRMLFAPGGPRDFLARMGALRRLLGRDGELLARHREQQAALSQATARARAASTRASEAAGELAARSRELEREREGRRRLAARVAADRARERGALIEFETAARALEQALGALEEAPDRPAPAAAGPPFASLRGALPVPVAAPIVGEFGRVVDAEFRTQTFRKGVEFAAPRGAPVSAVAAGRVRYAGWFSGYGRLVILDHGDQYFSVSGHLDEVGVSVGQSVARGEEIGTVGETGSLSGPRLYFEIRRGSEPLDPRQWLARPPVR
jgi:septal ring factor EnvC (AmiA/AmiB activator)